MQTEQARMTDEPTKELLSEVHRNLVMGNEALLDVLPKVQDKFLRREITRQMEGYAAHTSKVVSLLTTYGIAPEKQSLLKTLMAKGGIACNTLFDSSDEHIAEMIARGTSLGADKLDQTIARLAPHCAPDVLTFAKSVVAFERTGATAVE